VDQIARFIQLAAHRFKLGFIQNFGFTYFMIHVSPLKRIILLQKSLVYLYWFEITKFFIL